MSNFADLLFEKFLPALEESLGTSLTSLVRTFPSYINRVYEIKAVDGTSYVVKFYRPGRWTIDALHDEHDFIFDCAENEIPVVCPIELKNGDSLGIFADIYYAVYPKRGGRQFDIESDEGWIRVGALLARLHNAGQKQAAPSRLVLSPRITTKKYVEELLKEGVTSEHRQPYKDICDRIIDTISPFFEGMESIRIHGDFHTGNILERPDTGLMVIDFDDMMNGPPVQDMWLLLPDHYPASERFLDLLFKGYGQFREIDPRSKIVIEGLRAMRIIYFTAWCNMQRKDSQFQSKFPDWGNNEFWNKEIQDLHEQFEYITDVLDP